MLKVKTTGFQPVSFSCCGDGLCGWGGLAVS